MARLAKVHLHLPVTVIPNGVPWPEQPPRREEARQELGISPAARVALFVAHGGEEADYKFGDRWRTIWDSIKERLPEALCFAVGGQEAGREGDFIRWPYVDRERLARLMAAADVLLYPTRADNHHPGGAGGHGPGAARGSPSAWGGVVEQVTDQETGLLIEPFRVPPLCQTGGRAARRTRPAAGTWGLDAFFLGKKRFTMERMARDLRAALPTRLTRSIHAQVKPYSSWPICRIISMIS